MNIKFKKLEKKDYKKAILFAIKGMNFDVYFGENEFIMKLYGQYFLYSEMLKATKIIAIYYDDLFMGLLIASINGEKRCCFSIGKFIYVKFISFIQKVFFKSSAGEYDKICYQMIDEYKKKYKPDGEIIFLVSNVERKIKEIGSKLLEKFEKEESGKLIYLHTDDKCTYQFYEQRGFNKIQEKEVVVNLKNKIKLKCMLYHKKIN